MPGEDTTNDSPESARLAVVDCEREIQQIKAALRKFGNATDDAPNSLTVTWGTMDSEQEDTEVSLQLSSPIEEAVLKAVGEEVSFSGVETSVATLTATLRQKDGGQVLGNSEAYDLGPLCKLEDAMNPTQEEIVTELAVAIITPEEFAKKPTATSKTQYEKAADVEKGASEKEETEKEEAEKTASEEEKPASSEEGTKKEEESVLIKPLCTLTLKILYKPSVKDQKEELYELLNKASQRKSQALGKLRSAHNSETDLAKPSVSASGKSGAAVKAGFLNKKAKKKQDESKIMQFYNKYLGPNSLARTIFPIAKNYIIFFGAVVACHFKGDMLALPAPV